ncbi:hypothetical protein Hanom_Chr00s000001g01592591 [Helianthus anomalus]
MFHERVQSDPHENPSPVIQTRARPIFKMMKSKLIANNNLSFSHNRNELECHVAIFTHPKVLHNPYNRSLLCFQEPVYECKLLAMISKRMHPFFLFYLMHYRFKHWCIPYFPASLHQLI